MSTFGTRLKSIREKLNLKQGELGAIFKCSHAFISAVENDKNKLSVDNLVKLLVTYNVNINYLLAGIGEMFLIEEQKLNKEEIMEIVEEMLKERGL